VIGETISHYHILEKLGEGGMGVVYKATDTRLGRSVALKFVKAQFGQSWAREARLVAALNHPHIATLYDVGEHEGAPYLAMEFVKGVPLKGPRPAEAVIEYGIQVADAVAAAHAANVVHRDLKPANILLTEKGSVKILDFGLARAIEMSGGENVSSTQSMTIAGTPGYMAPEQLEGVMGDARSDIFAFGCVLYELASGGRAFPGESKTAAIVATAMAQPQPLEGVPERLEELILRCLRKDPERRFQSMLEVKIALEDLRDGWREGVSSVRYTRPIAARKRRWAAAALIGLALACAAAGLWALLHRRTADSGSGSGPLEITRLTTEGGLNIDPAISADGKLLAYASDHGGSGDLDIWVRQIGGGDPIRLTRDPADDREPNFSPDGTRIAFWSARDGGGLYVIPALGGTEQKLADGGRRPQFSPDGTKIAYWTGPDNPFPLRKGMGQMFVYDLATSTTRQLREDFAAAVHPVWSPDGQSILFLGLKDAEDVANTYNWWITPVLGGTPVRCPVISSKEFFDPFAWRGNRVYARGEVQSWSSAGVGVVTLDQRTRQPVGEPRRLTAGTTGEDSPSLSQDGRLLVFASLRGNPNLYVLPLEANRGKAGGAAQPVTTDEANNFAHSISADGKRVVFVSNRSGSEEIWGKDLATGQERALTSGGKLKSFPQITRDGELVAWKVNDIGDTAIFGTRFADGSTSQLCADCGAPDAWSADRKSLLFMKRKSARISVGLLDTATGAATEYMQDPELGLRARAISDDGKWLAFAAYRTGRDFTMYVAPFSPQRPPARSEWIRIPLAAKAHANPRWSPDGNLLYFTSEQDGYACIWAERLDPATKRPRGEPFAVQHFHSTALRMVEPYFSSPIALAFDKIVLSLESRSGGIWMLKLRD
jgi:Tol biopolymer transport system component